MKSAVQRVWSRVTGFLANRASREARLDPRDIRAALDDKATEEQVRRICEFYKADSLRCSRFILGAPEIQGALLTVPPELVERLLLCVLLGLRGFQPEPQSLQQLFAAIARRPDCGDLLAYYSRLGKHFAGQSPPGDDEFTEALADLKLRLRNKYAALLGAKLELRALRGAGEAGEARAREQLRELAEAATPNAPETAYLAACFMALTGGAQSADEAEALLRLAAAWGHPAATLALCRRLTAAGEARLAEEHLKACAQRGDAPSMVELAALYETRGGAGDVEKSYAWRLEAGLRGHHQSLKQVALLFLRGHRAAGLARNATAARFVLARLRASGCPDYDSFVQTLEGEL